MSVRFNTALRNALSDFTLDTDLDMPQVTVGCRFKSDASQSDVVSRIFGISTTSLSFYLDSLGDLNLQLNDGTNSTTPEIEAGLTTLVWHSVIAKIESATTVSIWLDGVKKIDNETLSNGVNLAGVTRSDLRIGGRGVNAQEFNGLVADACVWGDRIADDHCLAFSNGADPLMLSSSLLVHWSARHDIYADNLQLADFTNASIGTPTIDLDDNPPIIFPE